MLFENGALRGRLFLIVSIPQTYSSCGSYYLTFPSRRTRPAELIAASMNIPEIISELFMTSNI